MRKLIRDIWQSEVNTMINARLPIFLRFSRKSPGDWPYMIKYVYERSPGFRWAIAFRPLDDEFDAYVGWAINGNSPFDGLVQIANEKMLDEYHHKALMLPTATIARRSGATFWSFWNPLDEIVNDPVRFAAEFVNFYTKQLSEEEAHKIVHAPVAEAISEIETFCIPYLELVTSKLVL